MNRNFGKLDENNALYAPNTLYIDGKLVLAPRAEHYASQGWLPVVTDNRPSEKVGVYYTANGWAYNADHTQIEQQWAEHPIVAPVIVKKYSKLKLITAAKAAGKWDALKSWIAASGYSDEWAACMYLADDYAGFDQIKAALVASGIVTAEEVEAILAAAEDDTLRMEA